MTELCSRPTGLLPQTRDRWLVGGCLHFTAGCTTGWVNYANEPSQDYDVIRLTRSKTAVWTVDDMARSIEMFF